MQKSLKIGKHLSYRHYYMHLCKLFHNGGSKTVLKILSMMQSWIGLKFANLGQNNQILYKNREKMENICSIYIWGSNVVKVCTGVLLYLAKYISFDVWLNMPKIKHFLGKYNQISCKNRKNLGKNRRICICLCIRVKFCTVVVHKFSKDIIYDIKLDWSKIGQFLATYSNLG